MSLTPSGVSLRDLYADESARIEREFAATSDGRIATEARAALVDRVVLELSRESLAADHHAIEHICLVALGGYGRRALFPYSDIDLLFLYEDDAAEARFREGTRAVSQALWDLRLRVSPAKRRIAECEKFHHDNPEFNVSLLDHRYIACDKRLFDRLHRDALPRLLARARIELLRDISQLTRERHEKEGDTIFHLEPNVKNSPGGLRDYHVACWATLLAQRELRGDWGAPESFWPAPVQEEMGKAFDFLAATRCFLHYRRGRDDNGLSYELQAEAASRGVGVEPGRALDPADWMRIFFRHARTVDGLSGQLLDEATPPSGSLRGRFGGWRTRRLHPALSVSGTRLSLRGPSMVRDPQRLLTVFVVIAREGLRLSREAEELVREALLDETVSPLPAPGEFWPGLWESLRQILTAPHAARALRAMHSCGLLVRLFPEFAVIDSLVMRDFYHHYTVDAHSFMAIENIHRLREPKADWERPFGELYAELEQPALLFLSLLFHDVGKGMPVEDHVVGSLAAIEQVFPRLDLNPEEAETVRFLIRDHLAMSANLLRRDIFDPATIRAFAENVGTPERLKLLCLFTYADIRAVNPEALTPWKADSLWQLYVSTANYMSRSLDEERVHVAASGGHGAQDAPFVDRVLPLIAPPAASATRAELVAFLEGLPRRYVLAHTPQEIATHFAMSRQLGPHGVARRVETRGQLYVLTLLATDRPFLFAGISGTLAAWGMNIWKAEAFANAAGVVVDTFQFSDPHSTLALNPTEAARLETNLVDVLSGAVPLETLMRGRAGSPSANPPKVSVPTRIRFDDESSSHSTLMEIITQDRPGLLYRLSSALAHQRCNIEVALIDTEGQRAVDAFYLTVGGAKLDAAQQQALREALLAKL
jgi:[protein-PII] uridylyltransferase